MTGPQYRLIRNLLRELRELGAITEDECLHLEGRVVGANLASSASSSVSRDQATRYINVLLAAKRTVEHERKAERERTASAAPSHGPAPREELSPGMYRFDGEIYRVQTSRTSGHLYAKRYIAPATPGAHASFVYAPGVILKLRPEHRMTLAEATAHGAEYGTCCVCGRTLTVTASIEAGIGPVCASRV